MIKKQKSISFTKILAVAGLVLVILGCIASIYNALTNQRFIHDLLDGIYYLRFALLLGGGFIAGFLLTKEKLSIHKVAAGSFYALFTVTLFAALDSLRLILQRLLGEADFIWSKVFFEGMPLAALALTLLVIILSRYTAGKIDSAAKLIFIAAFIANQLFLIVTASIELAWASYLLSPFTLFVVTYLLLLKKQMPVQQRGFIAAFVGVFYYTLPAVLWEFQSNPEADAVQSFAIAILICSISTTLVLLWLVHRAVVSRK